MEDLNQAREWAEKGAEKVNSGETVDEIAQAAVRVIQSLPDEWVDAKKLREVVNSYEGNTFISEIIQDFADLLPAPQPRTLADMSLDELKIYIGGEVMVEGWANPTMLVSVIGDEGAVLARRLNRPWPFVEVHPLSALTPVETPEKEQHNG